MKKFFLIIWISQGLLIFAQENHFSQFYNSPQYLNPAFAGDAYYLRLGTASRYMRPYADLPIVNTLMYADFKMIDYHSGLALNFYHHNEALSHTKIQINYSYTIQMKNNSWIKSGIGFSFNQRKSGATDLKYPDQYNILGYTGNSTIEPMLTDKSIFASVAAGFIVYNKFLWISFSGDYLNRPVENFAGLKSIYPMKMGGAAGFMYPLNKNHSSKRRFSKFGGLKPFSKLGPIISYQFQGDFGEFSGGLAFSVQPFFGGIHYRYQHDFRLTDNNYINKAMSIMLGYRQEEFMLAYSYDIPIKSTTINRNGAHEISFVMYISSYRHDHKRNALVPVPGELIY